MVEKNGHPIDIDALFEDGTAIDKALLEGARDVRRLHKGLGLPLYEWREGRVVTIQPEDIVVDEPADRPEQTP
jgi:hypothetical protein